MLKVPSASGIGAEPVVLPLLQQQHLYEVVKDLTGLCLAACPGSKCKLSTLINPTGASALIEEPTLRRFTHLLSLLGGVPRFLERALFTLGKDSDALFRPALFLKAVEQFGDQKFLNDSLSNIITEIWSRYHKFSAHLQSLTWMPLLITCSLFPTIFYRSDVVRYINRHSGEASVVLSELEDDGIIFLQRSEKSKSHIETNHQKSTIRTRNQSRSQSINQSTKQCSQRPTELRLNETNARTRGSYENSPLIRPWIPPVDKIVATHST